jgi:hypothetical protein
MLADHLLISVRGYLDSFLPSLDSGPFLASEVVLKNGTTSGIQKHRWDTRRPVGYKTPGGIQDARWDIKRPVGYKTPGGILGSLKKKPYYIRTPVGSGVPQENQSLTRTPVG